MNYILIDDNLLMTITYCCHIELIDDKRPRSKHKRLDHSFKSVPKHQQLLVPKITVEGVQSVSKDLRFGMDFLTSITTLKSVTISGVTESLLRWVLRMRRRVGILVET